MVGEHGSPKTTFSLPKKGESNALACPTGNQPHYFVFSRYGSLLRSAFKPFPNKPWFSRVYSTSLLKNTVGKGEIARNEQFLLFPLCFLSGWRTSCHFHQI